MLIHRNVRAAMLVCMAWAAAAAAQESGNKFTSVQSANAAGVGAATIGEFQELTTSGPGGSVTLSLSGLPALQSASFTATSLYNAGVSNLTLGVDPAPERLFDFPGEGKGYFLESNDQVTGTDFGNFSRVAIIELDTTDAPALNLYAGYDRNDNGRPDASELACQKSWHQGDVTTARCILDLRFENINTVNVWALVDIPEGVAGASYHVGVVIAVPSVGYVLPNVGLNAVSGPGHTSANETFAVQLAFASSGGSHFGGPNFLPPGVRLFGAVLADDGPPASLAHLGADGLIPFAITRAPGGVDVLDAIDDQSILVLDPGEAALHRFVDVPGTGNLELTAGCPFDLCTHAVSFYATRAEFPDFSAEPGIAAAPAPDAGTVRWTLADTAGGKAVRIPVTPGRWYIAAQNDASIGAFVYMYQMPPATNGAPPPPAPGAYYNPKRAGHGIFLSRAGDQQVLYWYTYGEDGTPAWYAAQGTAPGGDEPVWHVPLYRVTWNGTAVATYHVVGDVTLTPISASDFIYSWHLDGIGGSERFTQLALSECLRLQGSDGNFTGQWFAPAQSGYGVDVLALPAQQFDAFYFYDAHGAPRWAAGSAAAFSAHAVLAMNQLSGFCPSCAYQPTVATAIGTLTMDFASPTQGSYSTNLALAPPLEGSWNISQPIARLTGPITCGL